MKKPHVPNDDQPTKSWTHLASHLDDAFEKIAATRRVKKDLISAAVYDEAMLFFDLALVNIPFHGIAYVHTLAMRAFDQMEETAATTAAERLGLLGDYYVFTREIQIPRKLTRDEGKIPESAHRFFEKVHALCIADENPQQAAPATPTLATATAAEDADIGLGRE